MSFKEDNFPATISTVFPRTPSSWSGMACLRIHLHTAPLSTVRHEQRTREVTKYFESGKSCTHVHTYVSKNGARIWSATHSSANAAEGGGTKKKQVNHEHEQAPASSKPHESLSSQKDRRTTNKACTSNSNCSMVDNNGMRQQPPPQKPERDVGGTARDRPCDTTRQHQERATGGNKHATTRKEQKQQLLQATQQA